MNHSIRSILAGNLLLAIILAGLSVDGDSVSWGFFGLSVVAKFSRNPWRPSMQVYLEQRCQN